MSLYLYLYKRNGYFFVNLKDNLDRYFLIGENKVGIK